MGKPRPASVLAGAVVGVGLVVAVVVAVMLVVGGVVFGVRRSRFLVLEGEELAATIPTEVCLKLSACGHGR